MRFRQWLRLVVVSSLALSLVSSTSMASAQDESFGISAIPNLVAVKNLEIVQRASTNKDDPNPVYKWCFTISGLANVSLAGRQVYFSEYNGVDSIYWNDQKLTIDVSGCISTQVGFNLGKTWLTLDVTNWANGDYVLTSTITNSQGSSAESQKPFTVRNPIPSIRKSIGPGEMSAVSGLIRYDLVAASSQVSDDTYIEKWCLSLDGHGVGVNDAYDATEISGFENPLKNTNMSYEPGCYVNHSGSSGSITSGSLQFDTTKWEYGTHTIEVRVSNSAGFTALSSFRVVTSQTSQKLDWLYPGDLHYFSSYFPYTGETYRVRGQISEPSSVTIPNSIKIRTWQLKSGWTKWSVVSVDSSGRFEKSYKVTSRMKVQAQIGPHGPIKTETISDVIPVNGHLRISAPETAHFYQRITFRISMIPKWNGYVSCSKTVTKNNWDYFSHPRIYLKNGIGTYSTVAGTDRITNIGLSCSADTNELSEASAGHGVTIF